MRTLLFLHRGQRARLVTASLCFVVKHSPVRLMPAITAGVADIVARPDSGSLQRLRTLGIVIALMLALAQNVPLHWALKRSLSIAVRSIRRRRR